MHCSWLNLRPKEFGGRCLERETDITISTAVIHWFKLNSVIVNICKVPDITLLKPTIDALRSIRLCSFGSVQFWQKA